jgi:hypothetical protein
LHVSQIARIGCDRPPDGRPGRCTKRL